MTDNSVKFQYTLEGWQECLLADPLSGRYYELFGHRHSHRLGDDWHPAGHLAARVLIRPDSPVGLASWFPKPGWKALEPHVTDVEALKATVGFVAGGREARWLGLAKILVVFEMMKVVTRAGSRHQWIRCDAPGHQQLGRNGQKWVVSPEGAVYLSAVSGLGRGTLRICANCYRLEAFARRGPARVYCDYCRSLYPRTTHTGAVPPGTLSLKKREFYRRAHERMYRKVLRLWLPDSVLPYRGKKRRVLPKEIAKAFKIWHIRALNAFREASDLHEWETRFAPKEHPGRREGTGPSLSWARSLLMAFLLGTLRSSNEQTRTRSA